MIKRFKEIIEGDLSLFETAVTLAPHDFEINEEKTQIRSIKKKEEEPVKEKEEAKERSAAALMTHIELQNKRSIYAVSLFLYIPSTAIHILIKHFIF